MVSTCFDISHKTCLNKGKISADKIVEDANLISDMLARHIYNKCRSKEMRRIVAKFIEAKVFAATELTE